MSDKKVYRVLAAFAGAKSRKQYNAAKTLCASICSPVEQLAFVDAARAARSRVIGGAL